MSGVMHIKAKVEDADFISAAGTQGSYEYARLISTDVSSTMAVGFFRLSASPITWTLSYDEVLYVLSGTLRLEFGPDFTETVVVAPGETAWIPKGEAVRYTGECQTFYAIDPIDWQDRKAD